MPLTDTAIRALKPEAKARKYADGGGLYLLVQPTGGKLWRMKYRIDGKEKLLAFGSYPDMGLKLARERREEARELLARGIDPGAARKEAKAQRMAEVEHTFENVAREWHALNAPAWSESYADKILQRMKNDVFPWIGARPIAAITAPDLLEVLRRIEGRGCNETARRAKANCGQVFRYAIATGRCERDPSADLRGALAPTSTTHFAAFPEPADVAGLLRSFDSFKGTLVVGTALRLAPLLFCRPGELRKMEWVELDMAAGVWLLPVSKMKMREAHLVPLAPQALALLAALQPLTGRGRYVFPGARTAERPMSDAAVNAALRRLGYDTRTEITGHGFRAMARTILHEVLGFAPDVIEAQLAHAVPDALGRAYNRTKFLPQRRKMMNEWADYLGQLKDGADGE